MSGRKSLHEHNATGDMILDFILWDVNPEVFHSLSQSDSVFRFLGNLRWYGLLFATAFLVGQWLMQKIYLTEGKPPRDVDTLTLYMVAGTVIGARLGHCLFYEPNYFLAHPIEILYIWQGGLASHGATIGILLSAWLFSRNRAGQPYLWLMDRIVILVALAGALIRTANFVNAEIVGKPTDLALGTVFAAPTRIYLEEGLAKQVLGVSSFKGSKDTVINGQQLTAVRFDLTYDAATNDTRSVNFSLLNDVSQLIVRANEPELNVVLPAQPQVRVVPEGNKIVGSIMVWGLPRHPAQLYEAFTCLLLFVALWRYWSRKGAQVPHGQLLGTFLVVVFGLRFAYELLKENQVGFEDNLALNMGQILSIPLVLFGVWLVFRPRNRSVQS